MIKMLVWLWCPRAPLAQLFFLWFIVAAKFVVTVRGGIVVTVVMVIILCPTIVVVTECVEPTSNTVGSCDVHHI